MEYWILIALLSILVFYAASFSIGLSIPNSFLIEGPSHSIQRIVLGYSIFIIAVRFCLRSDYPILIGYLFLALLLIFGLFTNLRSFKRPRANFIVLVPYLFAILYTAWIVAYPIIFSGAIFYGNHDPGDLNGFSVGFLKDGNSWSDLIGIGSSEAQNNSWWQSSGLEYTYPDYRAAVGFDNFAMLQRWGLPIIAAQLSIILKMPVWLEVFISAAAFFMLIPAIIYDYAQNKHINKIESILLSYSVSGVSLSLLWNEGLFAHIAAMPILLLFSFYLPSFFNKRLSIGQCFGTGLLITSLLGTWGEGVNLLIVLILGLILCRFIFKESSEPFPQSNTTLAIDSLKAVGFASIFCVIISPQAALDFLLLTVNKMSNGFSPGILGFNWSILDILAPLPFVRISGEQLPNMQLLVQRGPTGRIIESLIILFIALFFYKSKYFINLIIAVFSIFVFSLARQPYVFWNVVTILQPIIYLSIYLIIRERFSPKVSFVTIFIFTIVTMYSVFNLQKDYSLYSRSIYADQFQVKNTSRVNLNEPVAYLTPSLAGGYLRLGWDRPLFWVNKIDSWLGLKVSYKSELHKNLEVVAYFNCASEGEARCNAIKKNAIQPLQEYQQYQTGIKVKDLLDQDGVIDKKRMAEEVKRIFGVDYEKLNQTLP
jgi:hypothetical protein